MHEAHDALLCIAEGRCCPKRDRRRVTPEHWFKPAADMRALFADLPEACDNTLAIARRCAVMAEPASRCCRSAPRCARPDRGRNRPRHGDRGPGAPHGRHRRRRRHARAIASAWNSSSTSSPTMGFPGYFLIVADFIQWAKAQGIPVGPGRGSGAGSVAAWALTITDLDPLQFNLLFERFLNPERVSMPDFDIDFCQEGRDEVIAYVRREYGGDRVAQIITFGKLQARAAVRDVGRVLGLPFGQVNRSPS
jgi:DNA polymerase-3 subunit alpha